MSELFQGRIGRTIAESDPWWPQPDRAPEGAPNVVFVVLDDVGFADLGCYGSDIETPVMDGLAGDGVRYTNFHTTPICSPTRAALLTGRNPHSVGMGVVAHWDTGFPGYRGRISPDAATLAEMLSGNGYSSYAAGKWHLAPMEETTPAGPYDHWPLQKGFDRYYGCLDGGTNQWVPDLVEDNHHIDPPDRPDYHLVEDLVDRSIDFVSAHVSVRPDRPFFHYLAFGTAHYPLHAPASHIDKYRGRYDDGWDVHRERRFARQVELGLIPADTQLPPRNPGVRPWAELPADERTLCARLQEAYAGMIDHTDAQLGRFIDALRAMGAYDNTLFVLLSDNGATREGGDLGYGNYLRQINGLGPEPLDERLARLDQIGGPESNAIYPMGWAMAGNTPCRWYKQNTHGGGVRDPLIVTWPAGIDARGEIRHQYHHVSDVVPTVLELIDIDAPDTVAGVPQRPIEGTSMAYSLDEPEAASHKHVQHYETFGHRGIWADGWKAVTYHEAGTSYDDDVWELYHLDDDFSESTDLAAEQPLRLQQLVELWWSEAGRHQVLPLDDRILERFHVPSPRPANDRRRFVYYPGLYLPFEASPKTLGVSYTITAEVDRSPGDTGVLVACGDRFGGYALFVRDDCLVHDYNCAGTHYVVRSTTTLPTGEIDLGFEFEQTAMLAGTGRLYAGDELIGEAPIPQTCGIHLHPAGVSVGRSRLAPVSNEFAAPFAFTGTLHRVVYEIGDDRQLPGFELDQLFD